MRYNIIISKLATITTEYNLTFLKTFNSNYSLKMSESIRLGIRSLDIFPNSHSIYKKTNKNIYRKLLVKGIFHIVFTITNKDIIVLYVTDARKATDEYLPYLK